MEIDSTEANEAAKAEVASLNGNAIAKFLIADVFVLPGILLTVLESKAQSPYWLLIAIPGAVLYVSAFFDVRNARRLERSINRVSK